MCLKAKKEVKIKSAVRLSANLMSSLSWCLHEQLQSLSELDIDFLKVY